MSQTWQAESPPLDYLKAAAAGESRVRIDESKNAPRASYYQQGTITGGTIERIRNDNLQSGAKTYSFMTIVFRATSGTGLYMINGTDPNPALDTTQNPPVAGVTGIPIPPGNGVTCPGFTIIGNENIKAFRFMAETGQTLLYAAQLFE